MEAISASHRSRVTHLGSIGSLDDRTWQDLDLDEVFASLDRTESTLGQHALYHRLRTAPIADDLEEFERLVVHLTGDRSVREQAQLALSRLQDPHGYDLWWLAGKDAVEIRRWYAVFPILSATTLALLLVAPFWPPAFVALLAAVVINLIVRYLTDARVGVLGAAFRQVAPVIATAEALRVVPAHDMERLLGALGTDTPRLGRLKTMARWITGEPLLLPIRAGSVELLVNDLVIVAYQYLNLVFLLDACGVYFGAAQLRAQGPALLRVTAAVGEVDAALSVASFRAGRVDWTRPTFRSSGDAVLWRDVRHPLITDAVPNTLALTFGSGTLITGSNMSGKSTFLRTVGVTTVMAQTLNTCLAAQYRGAAPARAQLHRQIRQPGERQELLRRRSRSAPGPGRGIGRHLCASVRRGRAVSGNQYR